MASPRVIRVGTRGSALARAQAGLVMEALARQCPDVAFEVQTISTVGDETGSQDEAPIPGEGVFVKRIESALLAGDIDIAIHSYKDMPSISPPELTIGAFPPREDPRDALVCGAGGSLATLRPRAVVGTGSPRRAALLRDARPDIEVRPIRGNVDTRLRRQEGEQFDAVVVACAGLRRLRRAESISEALDPDQFVPAVGQGILAVQTRSNEPSLLGVLQTIADEEARICAAIERAVATAFGATCQTALGAYARIEHGRILLSAAALSVNSSRLIRLQCEVGVSQDPAIGTSAGAALLEAAHSGSSGTLR